MTAHFHTMLHIMICNILSLCVVMMTEICVSPDDYGGGQVPVEEVRDTCVEIMVCCHWSNVEERYKFYPVVNCFYSL